MRRLLDRVRLADSSSQVATQRNHPVWRETVMADQVGRLCGSASKGFSRYLTVCDSPGHGTSGLIIAEFSQRFESRLPAGLAPVEAIIVRSLARSPSVVVPPGQARRKPCHAALGLANSVPNGIGSLPQYYWSCHATAHNPNCGWKPILFGTRFAS